MSDIRRKSEIIWTHTALALTPSTVQIICMSSIFCQKNILLSELHLSNSAPQSESRQTNISDCSYSINYQPITSVWAAEWELNLRYSRNLAQINHLQGCWGCYICGSPKRLLTIWRVQRIVGYKSNVKCAVLCDLLIGLMRKKSSS